MNFDEIVERQGTYSAKWMGTGGSSLDYRNPAVKLPFQVADMDLACPEPIVQAMHRVADHRIFGYSVRTEASVFNFSHGNHVAEKNTEDTTGHTLPISSHSRHA